MKKHFVLAACIISLSGSGFAQEDFFSGGVTTPSINGKANWSNPSYGDLILDTSDNNFYGYDAIGSWRNLTASSIPASASNSGYVDTAAQTFAGAKTFNSAIRASGGFDTTGGDGVATSTGAGLVVAQKQYVVGTTYTNGTPTLTGTNWSTTRATLLPYQTVDGAWRLRLNVWGSMTGSPTSLTLSLSGVLFYLGRQALAVNYGGGVPVAMYAYTDSFSTPTNTIVFNSTSNSGGTLSISGDVELTGKPSWAD